MTKIKICGLKHTDNAIAATEYGADFLGVVFVKSSKRYLSPESAKTLIDSVKSSYDSQSQPKWVGVFQNQDIKEVNDIFRYCNLDIAQLSGNEDMEYCRELSKPIFKVTHISNESDSSGQITSVEASLKTTVSKGHIPMLDTAIRGMKGGTGIAFDWDIARRFSNTYDLIVAGGLNTKNVYTAIDRILPWGVDVSTGVESNGHKDNSMIWSFIRQVRLADVKNSE